MTSSSIRLSFVGAQVDCTTKTSRPRTFCWISTVVSPSEKRPTEALPKLMPQKTQVAQESVSLVPKEGTPISATSELVYNGTALAERALSDRMPGITTKALARAAVKFAAAEAATRGSQHAVNKGDAPWVGLLVGVLAHGLAIASEAADTRSWRTLPDEIQISRLWVPPGEYESRVQALMRGGGAAQAGATRPLMLRAGETLFLIERVML